METLIINFTPHLGKEHMAARLAENLIKAYQSEAFEIESAVILKGKAVEQLNTNPLKK